MFALMVSSSTRMSSRAVGQSFSNCTSAEYSVSKVSAGIPSSDAATKRARPFSSCAPASMVST